MPPAERVSGSQGQHGEAVLMSEAKKYECPLCGSRFDCPISETCLDDGSKVVRCPDCALNYEVLPSGRPFAYAVDRKEAL